MSFFPDIEHLVADAVSQEIRTVRTPKAALRVEKVLNDWFSVVRKKESANLIAQMAEFRKRIGVLARSAELAYEGDKIVVKATGDADTTLRLLRRGSDWFDPANDVDKLIAGAMLS